MDFMQLRYFLKIAERQNFTRAAEDLLISQSALSRSVAKLEEELGQPVFERQTRAVILTEAGKLLRAKAEQILALVEDTLAEIHDDGRSGRVRIGAIPTVAPYLLPRLLQGFAAKYPQANLVVYEETTDKLLARCHQGEVDCALLALPIAKQHLEVQELMTEELLLVLPAKHALVEKSQLTFADVKTQPFVLLSEAHCLADNIVSFCLQRSFQPVSIEQTSQLVTVQELVALGHGISMVPAMARELDHSPRRVYRSMAGPKPTRTVAMVWNPYRFQSRLVELFKEHVMVTLRHSKGRG